MNRLPNILGAALLLAAAHLPAADILPPGNRALPLGVHALTGGKVVVKPGEVLESGTVLIRDGLIEKVGTNVVIPPDARVWDMKGQIIYAGFIDPYLTLGSNAAPAATGRRGGPAVPERDAAFRAGGRFFGVTGDEPDPGNPGPGADLASVMPEHRVVEGFSPGTNALQRMREIGFTSGNVVPETGIIRGTSAFVALCDGNPNNMVIRPDVFQHVAFETGGGGGFPGSLMGTISAVRQSFFSAQHDALDRANYAGAPQARPRPPFNPAWQALGPALRREMTVVFDPRSALMVDRAARVAQELGLKIYMVSSGQEWRRPDLAKATGVPFIVPLNFPEAPRMPTDDDWNSVTLDQLRAWDWAPQNAALLRQQDLEIALTTFGLDTKANFRRNLRAALDRGLSEDDALAALTTVPAKLCGVDRQLGTVEAGKMANLTVVSDKGYFDLDAKIKSVWIDGKFYRIDTDEISAAAAAGTTNAATTTTNAPGRGRGNRGGRGAAAARELAKKLVARSPMADHGPVPGTPQAFLLTNATVWTCGPEGRLEGAYVLVQNGKISRVGKGLPAGTVQVETNIDLHGENVTPGIIDCHSHSMILGGVNESGYPSSAMVRIGDVVNSESANIYDQLAGGVTAAHLLHGSANPIGGQNCLIKLRDGASPEGLKFEGAIASIKFALGENVKQSNGGGARGGGGGRFPQSRMGVETFFANRFIAAQQYLKKWDDYNTAARAGPAVPPERDLELEALGEVLQGKRLIHCHSYRQDEILMLLRLMQGFHVQIGTFQHVLEGYKVADEMAQAGVGGSTFSDWWVYKFEVYDAIPYNGALMHDRGVVVSFNSDNDDLARRLYSDAAKAVKYGGVSEEEALKFVTLNPAKQLRVDSRVGSLEPGKDADFAIWSKSPLDSATVCLETWIEGKKYFDRSLAPARCEAMEKERQALLEKAKGTSATAGPAGGDAAAQQQFFETALEVQSHSDEENAGAAIQ
ncbi:MAG: amidohydrolase family protein [Verrucomicrobiota bacterium]|jgi:imidazolonepropionase-like amidohydrolase